MRPWYEPRKNRPDIEKNAVKKGGLIGFLEIIWREFFALIGLNLLFVVTCLPILTIPASLTAMSRITITMVRDRNYFLIADYWKAFRRDFGKSLAGGLLLFLMMLIFGFSAWFYYSLAQGNHVFMLLAGFSACLVVASLMASFFFFPMLAMVELKVIPLFKNSFVMAFACFKRSIPALLFFLLFVGALGILLIPQSTIYMLFLMFSLTNLITSYLVCRPIETRVLNIQEEEQPADDDTQTSGTVKAPELESAVIGEFPELDEPQPEQDSDHTQEAT